MPLFLLSMHERRGKTQPRRRNTTAKCVHRVKLDESGGWPLLVGDANGVLLTGTFIVGVANDHISDC